MLQLRRARPLEVAELDVSGHRLRVPTQAEMLRVKAWMIVYRNATRDFLDVAALASRFGLAPGGQVQAACAALSVQLLAAVDDERPS